MIICLTENVIICNIDMVYTTVSDVEIKFVTLFCENVQIDPFIHVFFLLICLRILHQF